MNYAIPRLPERSVQPREKGLTMVMDKGLSVRQAEDLISVAGPYMDLVKLGWSTSVLTPGLDEKLALYRAAGLIPYFGGTLFEVFLVRDALYDFERLLERYGMQHLEVSDGSVDLTLDQKLALIKRFAGRYQVLSEVGSKDASKIMAPYLWVEHIEAELKAGAWRVITESRESGSVGVYRSSGEVREGLVDEILHRIPFEKLIFEAPKKEQQAFFIKLLGSDVSLGNIAPEEVIPLETLRLGLRSDTFHAFLQ
jgi:phosphosulfolactate synthase